jgi:hypothetical protein
MQTFLPSTSFAVCAQSLDSKRLNKQILEGYQILKVLSTKGKAWSRHPATLMWTNCEKTLVKYIRTMIEEAKVRGIKTDKNEENINALELEHQHNWGQKYPDWFSDVEKVNRVITTHRANLYKKDPIYYHKYKDAVTDKFNKPCCNKCNYFWVTHEKE